MTLTAPSRACATLIACFAICALALKYVVTLAETGTHGWVNAWYLARYFTILTNALVAVVFGFAALSGRQIPDRLVAGVVLWIGSVGLIYRLLLAELWEPRGLEWVADQLVHGIVPVSVFLWWLVFARKDRLSWLDPLLWLLWPLAYLAYALLRGAADGIYPYPFLDPARLSSPQLVWNVSRLMEGFVAAGYVLFAATLVRPARQDGTAPADQESSPSSSRR